MISETEYNNAQAIVDKYEEEQTALFNRKVKDVEEELKALFPKEFVFNLISDWEYRSVTIHFIFPEYDEDYGGEWDKILQVKGAKHNIQLHVANSHYGK